MEKNDFKWREHDKKCAGLGILEGNDNSITNETLSVIVDVPFGTVQRIRSNKIESGDIPEALEMKPRYQEGARKVRSKEWIQTVQELIDLP